MDWIERRFFPILSWMFDEKFVFKCSPWYAMLVLGLGNASSVSTAREGGDYMNEM